MGGCGRPVRRATGTAVRRVLASGAARRAIRMAVVFFFAALLLGVLGACEREKKKAARLPWGLAPADAGLRTATSTATGAWFGELPAQPGLPSLVRELRLGMSVGAAERCLPHATALEIARTERSITVSRAGDVHRLAIDFALDPPVVARIELAISCDELARIETAWGPLTRYAPETAVEEAFWPLEDQRIELAPRRRPSGACALEQRPYVSVGAVLGQSSDQLAFEKLPLIGASIEELERAYPRRIDATRSATLAKAAFERTHTAGAELAEPPLLVKVGPDRLQLALGTIEHAPARVADIDLKNGRVVEVRVTFDLARSPEIREHTAGQIEDRWELHDATGLKGQVIYHGKRQVVLEDDLAAGLFHVTIQRLGAALPPIRARRPPPSRYARFDLRDRSVAWLGAFPATPGPPGLLAGIETGLTLDDARKLASSILKIGDLGPAPKRAERFSIGRTHVRRIVSRRPTRTVVRVSSEEDPASMIALELDTEQRLVRGISIYFPWPGSKQWLRTRWGTPEAVGPGAWRWRAPNASVTADLVELPSFSILSFPLRAEREGAGGGLDFVIAEDAMAELPELERLFELKRAQ